MCAGFFSPLIKPKSSNKMSLETVGLQIDAGLLSVKMQIITTSGKDFPHKDLKKKNEVLLCHHLRGCTQKINQVTEES